MNIGRNDLCPCGSGKKYKKCCYLQNNNIDTELILKESGVDDFEDDLLSKDFNNQDFLLEFFNNLRKITLDRQPHIKEYYKIRKLHSEIVNTMVRYHESGKFELKIDNNYINSNENSIKNLETLHFTQTHFNLETREGTQSLYDLLIYKGSPNMNCITEDFINSHRYRKPEKIEFLYSMLDSKLGLFKITKTDFDNGYVFFKDIFTNIEYKIVDIALSGNPKHDDFYIYTRLIKYNDIIFSTGLNLIFNKKDSFIKNHINTHKKNYNYDSEFLRFTQLYNYYINDSKKIKIFTNIIK